MRILYVGSRGGTSGHRANALRRLGHSVVHVDPYQGLPSFWARWHYYSGGLGIDRYVARILRYLIPDERFDAVHVDSGEIIGPRAMDVLQGCTDVVSHLSLDNPYISPHPERGRWKLFRQVIRSYDLCVTVRRHGLEELMKKCGVRSALLVWQAADEVYHQVSKCVENSSSYECDVIFVGTWMPGRGEFIKILVDHGLDVRVYGDRWHKAPQYDQIEPVVYGGNLYGHDYAQAIAKSKIALVMLNDRNRDLHTTRTAEIPAIGTVICAPRTDDHLDQFLDGDEAVLFEDAYDCATKCKELLSDDCRRRTIAAAGQRRVRKNGMFNEVLMRKVTDRICDIAQEKAQQT